VSLGELVDKLTILEIKLQKITDSKKLEHINKEYEQLSNELKELKLDKKFLTDKYNKLFEVNNKLWQIEDEIRKHEIEKKFDGSFVKLARDVYFTNDERFEIKNQINLFFGSELSEQKEYEKYK